MYNCGRKRVKLMSLSLNSVFVLLLLPFCLGGTEQRCRLQREGSTGDMRCGSHWQRATRALNKHSLQRPPEGRAAAVEKELTGYLQDFVLNFHLSNHQLIDCFQQHTELEKHVAPGGLRVPELWTDLSDLWIHLTDAESSPKIKKMTNLLMSKDCGSIQKEVRDHSGRLRTFHRWQNECCWPWWRPGRTNQILVGTCKPETHTYM